ncbi:TPA: hypothetical protein RK256_000684 [Escherichia coli]|nr:hypothetical protein [Escherichia coli]
MTELTKEQLIEEAKLKIAIAKCHPNSGVARVEGELFKIAVTSLEAEPIAWKATFTQIDHENDTFTAMYFDQAELERWVQLHNACDFRADITPLYAALPPLVVPEEIAGDILESCQKSDAWSNGFCGGWNACRAAILQRKDDAILTNEDSKGDVQVRELTMLVKQLVSQLKKAKPDCKLPDKAISYLKRNGLISVEDVLR